MTFRARVESTPLHVTMWPDPGTTTAQHASQTNYRRMHCPVGKK